MRSPEHQLSNLLKMVLKTPYPLPNSPARYIESLTIRGFESGWYTGQQDDEDRVSNSRLPNRNLHRRYGEDDLLLFKETIFQDYWIESPDGGFNIDCQLWSQDVGLGDEGAIIALLLIHCPNLVTFNLEDRGGHTRRLFDIFDHIAKHGYGTFTHILPRLTNATFNHARGSDQTVGSVEDIRCMSGLLGLPSMRNLHLRALDRIQAPDLGGLFAPGISSITHLTLQGCPISPKTMSGLIRAVKGLKSFSYTWPQSVNPQRGLVPLNPPFDPYWLCCALIASARGTLEELTLRSGFEQEQEWNGVPIWMGSLSELNTLKLLDTDAFMLFAEDHLGWNDHFNRLLPPSLETLTLHDGRYQRSSYPHFGGMIRDLWRLEAMDFPSLKSISFEVQHGLKTTHRRFIKRLSKDCVNREISFEISEMEDMYLGSSDDSLEE